RAGRHRRVPEVAQRARPDPGAEAARVMLGAIVGDIVGSVYEFNNHRSTSFPLFSSDSFFTDDSVMTCALASSIVADTDFGRTMRRYGGQYPGAGYGGRFRRWLADESMGPYGSFGNGAAMRISPAGW